VLRAGAAAEHDSNWIFQVGESRFGHDAHAHLLDCGPCLFDLGLQFLHNVAQRADQAADSANITSVSSRSTTPESRGVSSEGKCCASPLLPESLTGGLFPRRASKSAWTDRGLL